MTHKTRRSTLAIFWSILMPLAGALAGYLTAVRGGHTAPMRMTIVGGVWGGSVGLLWALVVLRFALPIRRIAGVAVGLTAGIASGILLGWNISTTAAVGLLSAGLGLTGEYWLKHVTTFP